MEHTSAAMVASGNYVSILQQQAYKKVWEGQQEGGKEGRGEVRSSKFPFHNTDQVTGCNNILNHRDNPTSTFRFCSFGRTGCCCCSRHARVQQQEKSRPPSTCSGCTPNPHPSSTRTATSPVLLSIVSDANVYFRQIQATAEIPGLLPCNQNGTLVIPLLLSSLPPCLCRWVAIPNDRWVRLTRVCCGCLLCKLQETSW